MNLPGRNYQNDEICCVGAGLDGGFENTNEFKVMKFKEAMNGSDRYLE